MGFYAWRIEDEFNFTALLWKWKSEDGDWREQIYSRTWYKLSCYISWTMFHWMTFRTISRVTSKVFGLLLWICHWTNVNILIYCIYYKPNTLEISSHENQRTANQVMLAYCHFQYHDHVMQRHLDERRSFYWRQFSVYKYNKKCIEEGKNKVL